MKKILVILGLFIIGFIFFASSEEKKSKSENINEQTERLEEYIVNDILVSTNLGREDVENITTFLKKSLKSEFIPKDFVIAKSDLVDGGETEYRGSWFVAGRETSILYVVNTLGSGQKYIRIWTLGDNTKVDEKTTTRLLSEFLNDEFLSDFQNHSCFEDGESSHCGAVLLDSMGNKIGITVRTGIEIEGMSGPKSILSACFIPNEVSTSYNSGFCI